MESKQGILNRPVKNFRDKNLTYGSVEEVKGEVTMSLKEKKMQEITEHRKMAIMGNRQEKLQITNKYNQHCMQLDNAR